MTNVIISKRTTTTTKMNQKYILHKKKADSESHCKNYRGGIIIENQRMNANAIYFAQRRRLQRLRQQQQHKKNKLYMNLVKWIIMRIFIRR